MTIGVAGTAYTTVIANDIRLIPISSIFDGQNGFDALLGANDIDIVTISGDYYAVVTGHIDDGVQIINITNPASPTPVSSVFDGQNGFDALDGARGINIVTISGKTYVLVAGYLDNAVQIMELSPTLKTSQFPPVLEQIQNHTIPELSEFRLDINATDSDTPASNLTYSATGLPTGSSFDTTTGVFAWTPTKAQNGIHDITVTVSDGATTDSQTFTITVVQNRSASPPP